jgi:hypothetical protein
MYPQRAGTRPVILQETANAVEQMQWSKRGAHLLLHTRVKTLNGALGSVFKRWYPELQLVEALQAA